MDIKIFQAKFTDALKKYRYAILVLIIGIVFMLLPTKKGNKATYTDVAENDMQVEIGICQQIETILEQVEGAGSVRVMLSEAEGREIIYQTDEDVAEHENDTEKEIRTVIISDNDKNETALIRKDNPPKYLGVIVVCQGADQASVRLGIVDAVSKITGLGADRISVLKMK